jgi:hypothetical protein
MPSKFQIVNKTTLLSLFSLILLGACTQKEAGLMSEIEDKYRNNSFIFTQVDESMIRAVGGLDTAQALQGLDKYVEKIVVFDVNADDRIYDSTWSYNYMSNIDYSQFEELAEMTDDTNKVKVLMVLNQENPQVFDVVMRTPSSLKVIEITGDNPMGITTSLAQGLLNGEDPMSTLSNFGL